MSVEILFDRNVGTISYLFAENFITYSKVYVRVGPNLNLVVGPNGCGKSTVLSAIVLGLGGRPAVAGRGGLVAMYIKQGHETATIKITLKGSNGKDRVIVRNFDTQSVSRWTIDDEPAVIKDVWALCRELNIDVNNLCQVLPQDKLQEFARMNAHTLLTNTVQTAGNEELYRMHNSLKNMQKELKETKSKQDEKERELAVLVAKQESMKEAVSSFKEKKSVKKRIQSLKQKRAWVAYDSSRTTLCESKAERDKVAADMKKLDEKLKPYDHKIKRHEKQLKHLQITIADQKSRLNMTLLDTKDLFEIMVANDKAIMNIKERTDLDIETEKNRDYEIAAVKQQRSKLENDLAGLLADVGSDETAAASLVLVDEELETMRRSLDKLTAKKHELKCDEERVLDQIRAVENQKRALDDVEGQRLELLRRKSRDAYEGVMWLRQNRDKMMAPVHEPMLLSISAKQPEYAKYLESVISYRDLIAFVCEEITDTNLLLMYLRDEKKLQVNVAYCNPNVDVPTTPRIPIDRLRQSGFTNYLTDFIEAPATIMKYLISNYGINNIPVGTEAVDENIESVPREIRSFFSQHYSYAVTVSKYSHCTSSRSAPIYGNGLLSVVQNSEKCRELDQRLESLHAEKSKIRGTLDTLEAHLTKINHDMKELRGSKKKIRMNIQVIEVLKARISFVNRKICKMEEERMSEGRIRGRAFLEVEKIMKQQRSVYPQVYGRFRASCRASKLLDKMKNKFESVRENLIAMKNEVQGLRQKCAVTENRFKLLDEELSELRNESEDLLSLALESTNQIRPSDKKFKPFHTAFAKLPPALQDIDDAISAAQAKLYCLAQKNEAGDLIAEYEECEEAIENLNGRLDRIKASRARMQARVDEIRPQWLSQVEEIIERISSNFSRYFRTMRCAGEIQLRPGSHRDEFDNYGVSIMVKFRDNTAFTDLTRTRQSGGEKALSIAVYMLALQGLSVAPFRIVDEINQGMDAKNEERIFKLIVEVTSTERDSQYFFLTPKLLAKVQYGSNLAMHCVQNGEGSIRTGDFDVAEYIRELNEG